MESSQTVNHNQWISVKIVRWQKAVLSVCDKPFNTNKRKVEKGEEIYVLRNCA